MPRFEALTDTELSDEFLKQTKGSRIKGALADVYRQLAQSEPATLAYFQMEKALQQGPLTDQEVEAVKLVVSEVNQCEFCLSVHLVKSKSLGLTAEQIHALRAGDSCDDERLDAVAIFTRQVLNSAGKVTDDQYRAMQLAGFTDQALVDILLAVSTISFTNLFNGLNQTSLMFKAAPNI